jgi:hypothetical protein
LVLRERGEADLRTMPSHGARSVVTHGWQREPAPPTLPARWPTTSTAAAPAHKLARTFRALHAQERAHRWDCAARAA